MDMNRLLAGALLSGSVLVSGHAIAGEKIMVDKDEYEQLKATVQLLMRERAANLQAVKQAQEAASQAAASAQAAREDASLATGESRKAAQQTAAQSGGRVSGNEFNPAISLILDGRYTSLENDELALPGFQLAGEAELPEDGFATGHNELVISGNIDDKFYGWMTAAIVQEEGETEVELEEAYFETLGLGHGLTLRGGQFFSGIGYLNSVHDHAHDFADRPLVYDGMFGGHLTQTGLQARWVAPTELFLSLGAEISNGSGFPGGEKDDQESFGFFVKTGADIDESHNWQLGASRYAAKFDVREAGGHAHGGGTAADNELLNGEVEVTGLDFVYKWAPNGNPRQNNFKFQAEYFWRDEEGHSEFTEDTETGEADYEGEQEGYYAQAIYQFMPRWRAGVRYDHLKADNRLTNIVLGGGLALDEYLEESGLGTAGDPNRLSFMVDYSPSHFSRFRLQFSDFDNGLGDTQNILLLQYIMSLGSHPAHTY